MNPLRLPVPTPRQMGALVLVALSVGIVTGRALEANSAEGSPVVMAEGPPAKGGTVTPKASASALAPPTGNVAPEPAVPEPAPEPAAPVSTASEPAPEPSEPVNQEPAEQPAEHRPAADEPNQEENTQPLTGTVVLVNPDASAYVLATDAGDLVEVHAKKLPKPRVLLDADVTDLDNGTTSESKRSSEGSNATAKLRGTVTYVALDGLSYVVSAHGASLLVRTAAGRTLPGLLDLATVDVHFDDTDQLVEDTLKTEGKATGAIELHGKVQALDPTTRALTFPADDLRELELDLTIAIPADLDIEGLAAGQVIAVTATVAADGSYTLESWRRDDNARVANRSS